MKRLSTLFEKHYRSVCAWVRRFGIAERDAEDVAQDIFVAAVEGFERYDPTRPFGPWLKTIASRRVRDHALLRDRDRLRPAGSCWEKAASDPTPEELVGEREHRAVVVDALARVERELREVLVLSAVEERSQLEIATLLALTEPTVQSRLRRARAQFAKRYRAEHLDQGRPRARPVGRTRPILGKFDGSRRLRLPVLSFTCQSFICTACRSPAGPP